jgi:hypothetical protein
MTASDRFRHVAPDAGTRPVFEEVRACFTNLVDELDELLPEGREKALALTKLEEALSWANAAVARAGEQTQYGLELAESARQAVFAQALFELAGAGGVDPTKDCAD